jgi:hypothetical protein
MPLPRPAPGTGRWWLVGTLGCAAGVAVVVWLALANTLGKVTWTDTGYRVVDDRSVRVEFDVHRSPGQAATCTVRALDQRFGVVGAVEVEVPAGPQRTVHQEVTVRTTSRAVTGTVQRCDAR